MLDTRLLRSDLDSVVANLARRGFAFDKQAFVALEERRKALQVEVDRLRNAPTRLMKDLGYGAGYRYAHDEQDAFSPGQTYFPDALGPRIYYHPVPRGLEIKIGEALERHRGRDKDRKG